MTSSVTLTNAHGLEVTVLSYGGTIQQLRVPDRHGNLDNIVLGFPDVTGYHEMTEPYFGAIVGRYAGRIDNATFDLDGTTYPLFPNNNGHCLHGGEISFSHREWDLSQHGQTATLHRVSPDGEDGFPGSLDVTVTYDLTDDNALTTTYVATTDAPTVLNLTNHTYFNLAGEGSGDVLDHVATINSRAFLPIDATLIPTGETRDVEGTPFDFREPRRFRDGFDDGTDEQIRFGKGYDITYMLDRGQATNADLVQVCRVHEPTTGRVLTIQTTEPAVQFYTGCTLDSTYVGTSGKLYRQAAGFCFETQHCPDSPNKPNFPSTVLRPGEEYRHVCVWEFRAE